MNLVLETDSNKKNLKRKVFAIVIIVLCLIAILVSAYMQVFKEPKPQKPGEQSNNQTEEQKKLELEQNFENIFTNETHNQLNQEILITNKIKKKDDIIGKSFESKEKVAGKYSLDVKIPYININNAEVKKYNSKIEEIFKQKALDIIANEESNNVIYNVDYVAYVNKNYTISIVIKSVLKEGSNAQRTIIQTYNYDFSKNKVVQLNDILDSKKLKKEEVESKIQEKIRLEQAKVDELKNLGYTIFERDYNDEIYKIENTTEFFIGQDDLLYLIYAYGNNNYTSELDIVIF